MNKIIKVTDDEVFVGMETGECISVEKSSVDWNVRVGDYVEVYKMGDDIILNLVQTQKKMNKHKGSFLKTIINFCSSKKVVTIFSVVFAFCIISLVILSIVPHGKKYKGSGKVSGVGYVDYTVTFKKDEVTIEVAGLDDETNQEKIEDETFKYKIKNKCLYLYVFYDGYINVDVKITSTTMDSGKIKLKEVTLYPLSIILIVFSLVSGAFEVCFIVFFVLKKKNILKIEKNEETDNNDGQETKSSEINNNEEIVNKNEQEVNVTESSQNEEMVNNNEQEIKSSENNQNERDYVMVALKSEQGINLEKYFGMFKNSLQYKVDAISDLIENDYVTLNGTYLLCTEKGIENFDFVVSNLLGEDLCE